MYTESKVFCVIFSFIFLIAPLGSTVTYDDLMATFNGFPCQVPQPRAFTVREISKQDYLFHPAYIILHQCGRAGCCNDGKKSCQPEESETVYFKVNYVQNDIIQTTLMQANNHTRCGCHDPVFIK
ncbi:hypothetical protein GWI33_019866 [Rhynchophorus ferrugineus]|uniref:Platelet-derived growth factor (PDGF) family profile domain-containing protein n=1 Tax=Rhynchophorus ferrugineus TaxID=354439 RepID=A0A834HSS9_RHYFE|nr:hypothetical protein GWI33_019866 [Rhynchophorus ferrugineus]